MSKSIDNKQYIFVLPKVFLEKSKDEQSPEILFTIVNLLHPKTKETEMFMMKKTHEKTVLCEINCHLKDPSSWFVGNNYVLSDGSIYISSPIDPLFLLLPYLSNEKSGKYILLDQILDDSASKVFDPSVVDKGQIMNLADHQSAGPFSAYKYNEEKTLEWLQKKVLRLSDAIHNSAIFTGGSDADQKEADIHYAFGMISDYIDSSLSLKLKNKMNITDRVEKRKSLGGKQPSAKKAKSEATEDYSLPLKTIQEPPKKNLNRAQKSLKKVDKKGMKNISSFFKAKPKPTKS